MTVLSYKPIKLHEETYHELDSIRVGRETFDGVIRRLLKVHRQLQDITDVLGPHHFLLGPNPPSSRQPLPAYCTYCHQPLNRHEPWCPNRGTGKE